MAEHEELVTLKQHFYRDGFNKVIMSLIILGIAVLFLIGNFIYLLLLKPLPVRFVTDSEWRVVAPVPLDKPYLKTAELLQWVGEVLPSLFNYNFINYKKNQETVMKYFSDTGGLKFLEVLNDYISYDTVQNSKLFVNATPLAAPIILNQGLIDGRYAWWVQMPLNLNYVTVETNNIQSVQVQALVVRVPTVNNLQGVMIDNIIVTKT